MDFLAISGCETHFKSELCQNRDRHGEAAYEIFSLERRFQWSKSRFSRFRKSAHEGIKKRYPHISLYFTVVGQSFMKIVADRHGHAAYHNKH